MGAGTGRRSSGTEGWFVPPDHRRLWIGLLIALVGPIVVTPLARLDALTSFPALPYVLIVVIAAMYMIATPYYGRVREAVGLRPAKGATEPAAAVGEEELARLLDTRRPETLLVVGGVGLLVLIWLMVLKPG